MTDTRVRAASQNHWPARSRHLVPTLGKRTGRLQVAIGDMPRHPRRRFHAWSRTPWPSAALISKLGDAFARRRSGVRLPCGPPAALTLRCRAAADSEERRGVAESALRRPFRDHRRRNVVRHGVSPTMVALGERSRPHLGGARVQDHHRAVSDQGSRADQAEHAAKSGPASSRRPGSTSLPCAQRTSSSICSPTAVREP